MKLSIASPSGHGWPRWCTGLVYGPGARWSLVPARVGALDQ